jgi:hypothetical protein
LPDDYLIFAFLAALRDAGSLKELYRTAIKAPNDQVRLVDDSVARIQTTLETREQTFLDYHERIVGRIVSGELRLDSDAQLLNAGNSIVEALYLTAPASTSRDSIVDQAYVFSMYVVFLARRSASGGKRAERNDFEDAHLLLHVDRPTPWTLVTDDSAFHQLARQIVAHWQRMGDTLPACQLRVMNQETLLRESGIP